MVFLWFFIYSNLGGSWTDVTNDCLWYLTRHSKAKILINRNLKLILCYIPINQNVSNQSNIVTIAGLPIVKSIDFFGIGTSETSNVSIDIGYSSNTLKSSHSKNVDVSQPRYFALGCYTI